MTEFVIADRPAGEWPVASVGISSPERTGVQGSGPGSECFASTYDQHRDGPKPSGRSVDESLRARPPHAVFCDSRNYNRTDGDFLDEF